MRRAPIVIATTIAGTVGVLTFQPREPSLPVLGVAGVADSAAAGSPTASTPPATPADTTPGASTAQAAPAAQTATGDSIATQYGPVQVKVTVKSGKITTVVPLALTGDDPKSAQISASAAPMLISSTLSKQSAAVDAVSGATVTTAGYEASLQSALDKIGFEAADGSRGTSTVPQVEEHGGPGGFGH